MSDASQVYKGIDKLPNINYPTLVPNMKGLESAINNQVKEIAVFTAASETFCKKNINCTIDESLNKFEEVIKSAKQHNMNIRGYISCVTDCPYEGETNPEKVNEIANKLIDMGCYEISLGDTIGKGTPGNIYYNSFLLFNRENN